MVKICDIHIENNKCYYILYNTAGTIPHNELKKIIEHKSWTNKITKEKHNFVQLYKQNKTKIILQSNIGFATILIRYLQSIGYIVNGKNNFKPEKILIKNMYHKLWDFQENAIISWFKKGGYGIIKSPTGSGKTIIACGIIETLKTRTIICVHTSDLLINVWYNTIIQEFTESIKNRLGIIGGGLTPKDRQKMRITKNTTFEENIKKDIVIATSQTLINNLDKLSNEKFGLMIIDESHHFPAEQFKKVVSNIRSIYRLGLTGTLIRPDGMTPMLWGLIGNIAYKITIKELVKKRKLVDPIFTSILLTDSIAKSKIQECKYDKLEYSRYIKKVSASSKIKKDYIIKLIKKLCKNNKKFILYTDYVTPNGSVYTRDDYTRLLRNEGVRAVSVTSDMSGNEREEIFKMLRRNKIDGLVFGRLGAEGINIPEVDSVIMANATASTIMFPQRVGRAMRKTDNRKKNAYIYEILLDIPLEVEWAKRNFYEYATEGYIKKIIKV